MNFEDYSQKAQSFGRYPKIDLYLNDQGPIRADWLYPLLGLVGEAGELADKLKKVLRDDQGKLDDEKLKAISKERGDVLWYLSELSRSMESSLDQDARTNIEKLTARAARGTLKGSGDDR